MIPIRTTIIALALLTLFVVLSATPFNVLAAEAQSQPEAQKPPVAKKQPKPRASVIPKLGSYDDSWREKAYSNPVAAEYTPSRTVAAAPATQAAVISVAAAKPQAKAGSSAKPAAGKGKRNPDDPAVLKEGLDVFAKDCIVRMNRQLRPGITHKEIKRQADGTFIARYMAIDPDSLATSYNPTDNNKVIKYIGRMEYHEVEYISVGKDQKQALAGPFSETNRMPVTELIKYKSGKWCY